MSRFGTQGNLGGFREQSAPTMAFWQERRLHAWPSSGARPQTNHIDARTPVLTKEGTK
jgi:hypothetical protein